MTKLTQDRSNLDGADELEIEPRFKIQVIPTLGNVPNGAVPVEAGDILMIRRWLDNGKETVKLGYIEVSLEDETATIRVNVRKGARIRLIANGQKVNG
jgi:hypothetical protein